MSNIMSLKQVRNKPHRNGFDLSRRVCFTDKTGQLTPVAFYEMLPGDTAKIRLQSFMRTIPLNKSSFARIREYYDVFFVPYSLLWDKWNSFIVQTNQPTHAVNSTTGAYLGTSHPYFTIRKLREAIAYYNEEGATENEWRLDAGGVNLIQSSWRLCHNLGYFFEPDAPYAQGEATATNPGVWPSKWTDTRVNPFPLLAYQKIYQDYFRNSQWEEASPWTYNLDYMLTSQQREIQMPQIDDDAGSYPEYSNTFYTQRYVDYDKDMYFGAIPSPQFGDESKVDVANILPLGGSMASGNLTLTQQTVAPVSGSTPLQRNPAGTLASNPSGMLISSASLRNLLSSNMKSDMLGQFSVLAYRRAEARQKWAEITLSGDLDYRSQIQKHWGVTPPRSESYMCQRLGGCARNLDVSEVVNTNLVDGDADIAGRGIVSQDGTISWKNDTNCYGILMIVNHKKPIIEWGQDAVFESVLTKTTADRYAIPEFDQLGNEALLRYQFQPAALDLNDMFSSKTLGYGPRYMEYKTSFDIARGTFLTTNRPWILPYQQPINGNLSVPLAWFVFKVQSNITDNMFISDAGISDPYLNSVYIDFKVVRNLDRDGLPY